MKVRLTTVAVTLAVLTAATALACSRTTADGRPNVLVVMVDDATYEEIRVMANVNELLRKQGTSFAHFYTTSPNCCPSRGGFYTGQYPHNNKVRDNIPPLGGAQSFVPHENESLGVWMQRAGYYTAQIGKYLNGWGSDDPTDKWTGGITPQPGWDHWFVGIDPTTYRYYGYEVSDDGQKRTYGNRPEDYQTDVTGREALDTIGRATDSGKPWFITWSPMSPHIANKESTTHDGEKPSGLLPVAADRYQGLFRNEPLPASPSLAFGTAAADTADLQHKPAYLRRRIHNMPVNQDLMRRAYDTELEALQSVDEWIGKLYHRLQDLGQLDHTDIIFWSDNGLFHGEHGLMQKGLLYEEAAHIPLVIRGAGFPPGSTAQQLALNIDLPATILALGQASAGNKLDGRNLQPVASDPAQAKDRAVLLEYWYSYSTIKTTGLRLDKWSYMEWSTHETELYDLDADPHQMTNLAGDPRYQPVTASLHRRLAALADCAGPTCEDSDASRSQHS